MANTHAIQALILCLWRWLTRKFTGGYGQVTSRSEFEKSALIEKYGFNRYL